MRDFGGATIDVRINSFGGSVFDGISIYNILRDKSRRGCRIDVGVDGIAASAASIIACAGDVIHVAANALMMIHRAETFAAGNSEEMAQTATALDKVDSQIAATYVETSARLGKNTSSEKFQDLMKAETWLTAEEALDLGLATEITTASEIAASARVSLWKQARIAADASPREIAAWGAISTMLKQAAPTTPRAQSPQPHEQGSSAMHPDLERLITALGAKDFSNAMEMAESLPGVIKAAETATNTATELHDLTGQQGPQAMAVVRAWKAGYDALPTVTTERDTLQAKLDADTKASKEAAKKSAVQNKVEAMFASGKLTVAMKTWAEGQSIEALNAYEAVAPVVVPGAGGSSNPTEPEHGEAVLTESDRKVMAKMNISAKDFLAAKQGFEPIEDDSSDDE